MTRREISRATHARPAHFATAAGGALDAALAAGLKGYDRASALARFHRLSPETIASASPEAARAALKEIERAMRAERARRGHWSYDLPAYRSAHRPSRRDGAARPAAQRRLSRGRASAPSRDALSFALSISPSETQRPAMYLEKILALLAAALVAIGAGIGLTWLALNPSPHMADASAVTRASAPADKGGARQQIETLIASTPDYARYFARLRETFTADYEAAINDFATRLAETKEEQSVDYYLSEAVRRIRTSHGALAAKAEPEPIARVFEKQLEVLQAVAREDKRMCVAFLYGATNLDFQRFAASRRQIVSDMALAGLEAIVSGQAKNIERAAPTDADFRLLETALASRGLGKVEIDALLDGKMPNPPLEDARMCGAAQTYFEVLKTLPEPARTKVYGLALELMARS